MKIIKRLFKGLLIYGITVNFLYGLSTIMVENYTALADYHESKGNGGERSCKLTFSPIEVWKRIFKNFLETKKQLVRMWKAL